MPQRTFQEARREIARADNDPKMVEEFDAKVAEATERVRAKTAGQRQRLEAEMQRLAMAAKRNRDRLQASADDLARKRITRAEFDRRVNALKREQRVVVVRAQRTRTRLDQLADMADNAPDTLDRIARASGLGKTDFSF